MAISWPWIAGTAPAESARPHVAEATRTRSRWLLALLFLLSVPLAHGDPRRGRGDAGVFLRKAERAERKVTYSGIKVVRFYGPDGAPTERTHEVRVSHQAPNKTRLEVMPPARIAGQITVEVGEQRSHFFPWEHRWVTFPGGRTAPPLDLLLRNYSVREAGVEVIAGRSARLLHVRPRYAGSRRKNVWIDRATSLVLKSEFLNAEGRPISGWEFRTIEFPTALAESLFVTPPPTPREIGQRGPRSKPIEKPDFPVLVPTYLPPGFVEQRRSAFRQSDGDQFIVRYTDGLSMIFFGQQRARPEPGPADGPPAPRPNGPGGRPDGGFFGRGKPRQHPDGESGAIRLSWTQGELRLTLIGDVARSQLEKMAASMRTESPRASALNR